MTEVILEKKAKIREIVEKVGEGGKKVLKVEMEEEENRNEIIDRKFEIMKRWKMGIDEELTIKERKRWRLVEKAREE